MNFTCHPQYSLIISSIRNQCVCFSRSSKYLSRLASVQTDFSEEYSEQKKVVLINTSDINDGVPSDTYAMTSGVDGHLRVYTTPFLDHIYTLKVHEFEPFDLDARFPHVASLARQTLHVLEMYFDDKNQFAMKVILTLAPKKGFAFRDARFSKNGKYLYVTQFLRLKKSIVQVYSTSNWNLLREKTLSFKGDHHTSFTVDNTDSAVALGTSEGKIIILDAQSFKQLYNKPTHSFFVTNLLFSSSSNDQQVTLYSCSADNAIKISSLRRKHKRKPVKWLILPISAILIVIMAIIIEMFRSS